MTLKCSLVFMYANAQEINLIKHTTLHWENYLAQSEWAQMLKTRAYVQSLGVHFCCLDAPMA